MKSSRRLLGLSALTLFGACLDRTGVTGPQPDRVFEGTVSNPVRPIPPPLAGSAAAGSGDSVVYVSLVPGAVVRGASATIRNRTTGYARTDPLVAGGLDPVPVPAQAGDTLAITVRDSAGRSRESERVVPLRVPPIVVRTEPPRKKTGVPLNTVIAVVLSEPVDPTTVGSQSVHLLRAGQPVSGVVSLSADGLRAELTPDADLAPETDYTLEVTGEIADLSGDRLDPVQVDFTTGSLLIPVVSVTVTPESTSIDSGSRVRLTATARGASGEVIAGREVQWSSSNPAVLTLDETGKAFGASPGTAEVTATMERRSGRAGIAVHPLSFVSVSAGAYHTCAVASLSSAFCWGDNSTGQLGTGDSVSSGRPHLVVGGLRFLAVDAGSQHTCGLDKTGRGYCWGYDNASHSHAFAPDPVPGFLTFTSLTAGNTHSCGLSPSGTIDCWGRYTGVWHSFYDPEGLVREPFPISDSLGDFASVTAGTLHGCGVTVDGGAFCWGSHNESGELGDGSTQPSMIVTSDGDVVFGVVPVAGGLHFASTSAGGTHTCGISTSGAAYCWGQNWFGELGAGSDSLDLLTPALVSGGLTFTAISAGDYHTCGLTETREAYCWGKNSSGQLGDGSTSGSAVPVVVSTNLRFTAVTAGGAHTCGVATDSVVYCWGGNGVGQLGDGAYLNSSIPVRVAGQR